MDVFLAKLTQQAMTYAIRSGISITGGFAIQQCSRLLKNGQSREHEELGGLQRKLDSKIKIIAPAIDMIELIAARGNTSLESAVSLTKSLRWDIQQLGSRVADAASEEEALRAGRSRPKSREQAETELRLIIKDIKALLERIEDAVPLISLAITTSGASLSTNLPASISPSRLLQASTFISAGDARYALDSSLPVQIGPRFTLSAYMLFQGHAHHVTDDDGLRRTIWKEVIHKAQLKLVRVPLRRLEEFPFQGGRGAGADEFAETPQRVPAELPMQEFAYQLSLIEDLDDGRAHTLEEGQPQPESVDDVSQAGMKTFIPVHQVAKIFYADTGKILNIGTDGESNNPILLLKRDGDASPPRRMMEFSDILRDTDDSPSSTDADQRDRPSRGLDGLPSDLDHEWIALEVYREEVESDDESDAETEPFEGGPDSVPSSTTFSESIDVTFATAMSRLRLGSSNPATPSPRRGAMRAERGVLHTLPTQHVVASSLSLLEMLIRLTSLQQFQQASHLTISDELLNFFLEESSTTGAAPGDAETRRRIRMEARQHVGFDPYDESPIKRRGEAYQRQGSVLPSVEPDRTPGSPLQGRSQDSSRGSRESSARYFESTPPMPGERKSKRYDSPATPLTNKSRADFIREEGVASKRVTSSSPLARASAADGEDGK